MRYHIDTIPVWDAFKQDSECPLCDLRMATEQSLVSYFVGASVMEPGERVLVNATGFCAAHLAALFKKQERLPLALMTHTHMLEVIGRMKPPEARKKPGLPFPRRRHAAAAPDRGCLLCDRLEQTMERYLATVIHLWKVEKAFRTALEGSKGLCMPHFEALSAMADAPLAEALHALQQANMRRVEQELFWFTQKFDYRNADKPWGNSKDAVERAIGKLRGKMEK